MGPVSLHGSLYDPAFEHDACGIGFVVSPAGKASPQVIAHALHGLSRLAHRGAKHPDPRSGDGAGLLIQVPYLLLLDFLAQAELLCPAPEALGIGMVFLDRNKGQSQRAAIDQALAARGLTVLAWREVPTVPAALAPMDAAACPDIQQVLIVRPNGLDEEAFERALYLARRALERLNLDGLHIASLSCRTLVYKALLSAPTLASFYPDLSHPDCSSAFAIFHQRYSTNTLPSWDRIQPLRMLCHNGEINTLQGNRTWMQAREADLHSSVWEEQLHAITPVIDLRGSDSAMLDNVLEFLVRSGRNLPHAQLMLIPEAWEKRRDLPAAWSDFYAYHAGLMEPWDGPAALCFSDGRWVGACLDRNGLRPLRTLFTTDGWVMAASEAGVFDVPAERVARTGKLGPGERMAIDLHTGQIFEDAALKDAVAGQQPYGQWLREGTAFTSEENAPADPIPADLLARQVAFGYGREDLDMILKPMMREGQEAVGSMGDDTPLAVLSKHHRSLFAYFKQRFAEVTNPPIDPLREAHVMSLTMRLGPRENLLAENFAHARLITLTHPILLEADLERLTETFGASTVRTLATVFPVAAGHEGLGTALDALCHGAEAAVREGKTLLILSDAEMDRERAPIPSLLAIGAVHHHLIRQGLRMHASVIVASGDPREVHHVAALIGYGANAVCPTLALQTVQAISDPADSGLARTRTRKALEAGLLKVMAKMGIATLDAYCGAQIFEAVGIGPDLIARAFTGTPSRLGGMGLRELAETCLAWHRRAYPADGSEPILPDAGHFKIKRDGEHHALSPEAVKALHHAVTTPDVLGAGFAEGQSRYRSFTERLRQDPPTDLRDLLEVAPGDAIPLSEVEPSEVILRRFSTGAMSHGSLSAEAHETVAIAMNRLGAMSNSGEGGEAPDRFGTERNSRIKQVASGRFGVTTAYLVSASELQIKMAQGSKPGEGGQLPARKVTEEIARLRRARPGMSLISPPPHHDIYSIEDLAQLIYDLKQVNPQAAVSVKLVAQAGVGTIAAGVAKAQADVIHLSGHAGGTGASPLGSIKHAGLPWELGLSEMQQVLVGTGLRGGVRLRVDGGLRSGSDVLIAAILGADEFSFGTAALVAGGCKMVRSCHMDNCPVGIATQRPELRAKFPREPERVMAYMRFVAEEVREWLAKLGFRRLEEVIGRVDLLTVRPHDTGLDLSSLLKSPEVPESWPRRHAGIGRPIPVESALNDRIAHVLGAAPGAEVNFAISNLDRAVGSRLAGEIARTRGDAGLPEGSLRLAFEGTAGQSFGTFAVTGMTLLLTGGANDYVGKGLSGATIAIRAPIEAPPGGPLIGNVALLGATSGRLFVAGSAGERFAVRNSGALAVVEGLGDHGCEYMTGGMVVVLGPVGRNFGAGMTGGEAYLLEPRATELHAHAGLTCEPLREGEANRLRALIQAHLDATGSVVAAELLANWNSASRRFWRVVATDEPATAPLPLGTTSP